MNTIETVQALVNALDTAANGLEWYRDRDPAVVDSSDDEMDEQIAAAIEAGRAILAAHATASTDGAVHAAQPQPDVYLTSSSGEAATVLDAFLGPLDDPGIKLWLWKNFVDGRPEYWAFDNPYPINLDNGDPQTFGEPCGYAIFKLSRTGRTDVSDEQVLCAIRRAGNGLAGELTPDKKDSAPVAQVVEPLTLDQRYWVDRRADIIAALEAEGLQILSDKDRVWLHKVITMPNGQSDEANT